LSDPPEGITAVAPPQTTAITPIAHRSGMVPNLGWLIRKLLGGLFNGVVFPRAGIEQLRELSSHSTVVYVVRARSLLDYVYFNSAFLEHHIPLVRFANGVRTFALRPFWGGLRALFRRRRGIDSDVLYFRSVMAEGAPTLLFLRRPKELMTGPSDFAKPFIEAALQQEDDERPVVFVPLLLVWDKHPENNERTLFDEVFGTNQAPRMFRKMLYVLRNAYESFLNLGAPQVTVGAALTRQEFVRSGTASFALTAKRLEAAVEQERRVIVGPGVKPARQLRDEILTDERTQHAIRETALETGQDVATLQKQAGKQIKEIAADFSLFMIKLFSSVLYGVWSQIYDGLEIDEAGFERLRELSRDSRIVLVPSHKSHVDYLVLSYVFYRGGLIPPHIAAGVNLSFWPLGPIFRRCGAFFLRRSFSGDPLYPKIFNAYLVKLLEEGFSIEFFIEGTRSRTGRLNPPKYGMLNMIVEAFRSGDMDRLSFVPVSVGYENIIEGSSYRSEIGGGEKRGESIGSLLRTPQILSSKYGRAYVEFGEPVELSEFLETSHTVDPEAGEDESLARSVRRLAYRIIHRINDVTTVTPSALAALVVLNNPAKGMSEASMARELGFVVSFLRERQARMSLTLRTALDASVARIHSPTQHSLAVDDFDDFDRDYVEEAALPSADSVVRLTDEAMGHAVLPSLREALNLLGSRDNLVERTEIEQELLYLVPDDKRTELAYYRNNIIHYFVPEAVFATALYVVEGSELELDAVRQYTHFVSRLFKYEFCFDERSRFEEVFQRTLRYFEARGWVERDDPTSDCLRVTDPPPAGAEFLRGLLIPNVEAYYLAAVSVSEFASEWIEPKALSKRALIRGEAMHVKGELLYRESIAKPSLENAYRVFREWGVIEQQSTQRGRKTVKEWRTAEDYRGDLLTELQDDLRAMVAQQKRAPGELLRRI
jgi:glycerol-3-phosphate O-acyltransferase